MSLLTTGKVPEAQKVFEFVVSENPDHISANTNLGYIYMQQGNSAMSYMITCSAHRIK